MKVCVAGLGLIGGSMCMALRRAGFKVYGWNRSPEALNYALKNEIIDGVAENFRGYDAVFVALPPEAAVEFMCSADFSEGTIVSDICGVKSWVEERVYSAPRSFRYVGCHPMAGKEVSGIKNACADLFDRASMVITSSAVTDAAALDVIRELTKAMGFARIVECSAEVHDRKIAYTSQLAHVLSNAYVKDAEIENCFGFTGGSFQDMTRIAGVDERVWASLYMLNAGNLTEKISSLVSSLNEISAAISKGDRALLEKVLKSGRELFEAGRENIGGDDGIFVKNLK